MDDLDASGPEVGQAGQAWYLGDGEGAVGAYDVSRLDRHAALAVRAEVAEQLDGPLAGLLVPDLADHARGEQGPLVEPGALGDALQLAADLLAVRVPMLGHVSKLLQQRHVAVPFDVAHEPRVAVPVPRPAEAPSDLGHAHVVDGNPGLREVVATRQPKGTPSGDQDLDLTPVGHRRFLRRQRVVVHPGIGRELAGVVF